MRGRSLLGAALIAVLVSRTTPAVATARPELVIGAGAATAVEGDPADGGASLSLALLWPLESHFRLGLMGFGEDLGERFGRLRDSTGVDVGPVVALRRWTKGAAWRVEAHRSPAGAYDAFAVATCGVYRVIDEPRGLATRWANAVGLGLGLGMTRRIAANHAAGITLRYQQLSRGGAQRYLSATLDWRWHPRATE
jgi:hypothetical protein